MAAQSNAAQTFACALTGLSPLTDPVVTPSGYVCSRRLLLTRLSENGGVDPFDGTGVRRLDETALVDLHTGGGGGDGAAVIPPRPPKATSLPSLLGMLQHEFDAVLLELYDARKALEETRRELSGALYQNDAAVRVVARLARERDEARGRLEEFLREGAAAAAPAPGPAPAGPAVVDDAGEGEPPKRGREEEEAAAGDAPAKKAKTDGEGDDGADLTKIPADELAAMTAAWKTLSKGRKSVAKLKRTPEETAENEALLKKLEEGDERKVNLGKSSAKAGVLCLTSLKRGEDEYVIAGGHDNAAVVYDVGAGKILATLTGAGGDVTSVHGKAFEEGMLVVAGSADGSARVYSVPLEGDDEPALLGAAASAGGAPVDATVHPSSSGVDDARVLLASTGGTIELWRLTGGGLKLTTRLESEGETAFASGRMHPDGLIYLAGTTDGRLVVWDLKTQAVAGTLEGHDGNPVSCVAVSENGYHVATAAPGAPVHVWDLRKLKLAATIAIEDEGSATSLAFDPTATYLACAGEGGTEVRVAKDWGRTVCALAAAKGGKKKKGGASGGGAVWGGRGLGKDAGEDGKSVWLAAGRDGQRPLRFWGLA